MDYHSVKEYIKSLTGRGIVPGLDNIRALLSELTNPEKQLQIIHIAGTNGKGSVGAYISSIIESANMQCGRFVSPCVGEYENTFLINGKSVAKEIIGECADTLKSAMEHLEKKNIFPTSFEAETALAFLVFSRLLPDYVIIECGMGGMNDATNAIKNPALSVITKISLDHTSFLGDTIPDIATQKAGIIKNGVPVISATQNNEAMQVIEAVCKKHNAVLYRAGTAEMTDISDTKTVFNLNGDEYTTHMLGIYQPENASIAITVAKVLGISDSAIKNGIKNARWAYRFQRIGKFILDGAHNPDGATALAKSLEAYTTPDDTAFICACFRDKEYKKIAEIAAPYAKKVYCVTAPAPRGLEKETLCDAFKSQGADAKTSDTLSDAIKEASHYKKTVIFGTLSILDEAKQIIERSENNATL
ncbi:MAG: hypothetical protein IJC09_06540 [Clostridia bacterium]|nr:hypothetical protein [Clostridia bacterium]